LPCVNGEDGLPASPVGDLPDPRGSLSSAIPFRPIAEVTSKCRRQLKAWLEVSTVLTSTSPLSHLKLASIAC